MNFDCGFIKDNGRFRYRTGGILIHNGKMLFVKSKTGGYYYMIGGGVHLGETSVDCIEREIFEETGIRAKAERLAVMCENFFKGRDGLVYGMDCHSLEFYYYMNINDEQRATCKEQTDIGEQLVWININDLKNVFIKPDFISERISDILSSRSIIHIIEERDR